MEDFHLNSINIMFTFSLSQRVKQTTTGFEGIITARCESLHGPNRYEVSGMSTAGAPIEHWVTEGLLVAV